jgi:hypothetical protein
LIVARTAYDLIPAATAYDPIVAAIAVKLVVTSTASDPVVAAAANDCIVASNTIELVIASAAADEVVAAFAVDNIITAKAEDFIVASCSANPVGTIGPHDRSGRRWESTGVGCFCHDRHRCWSHNVGVRDLVNEGSGAWVIYIYSKRLVFTFRDKQLPAIRMYSNLIEPRGRCTAV